MQCGDQPFFELADGIDVYAYARYTREKYFEYNISQLHSRPIASISDLISFCRYALLSESDQNRIKESIYLSKKSNSSPLDVYECQIKYLCK